MDEPHDEHLDPYSRADVIGARSMLAAVFASLRLDPAATIGFACEPSTEATLAAQAARETALRVAGLPAGGDREAVVASIGEPPPRVLVCRPEDFTWLSKAAFRAGVGWVFTLGADRTGSLLDRAVHVRGA